MKETSSSPFRKWNFNLWLVFLILSGAFNLQNALGQEISMTLKQATDLAIANSHALKIDQSKILQAVNQYNQTKDLALPEGNISAKFSHSEIPAHQIQLGSLDWILPKHADSYTGGASLTETIFNGFKLGYARNATRLLTESARLDAQLDQDRIILIAIEMYHELYKVMQHIKVVKQNTHSIDGIIAQAQQFYQHGIVTKNDVLRFELQRSEVDILAADLEANRKNHHF